MHKEEASKLFSALADESRVKIVKMLYHNSELSDNQLLERLNCDEEKLLEQLSILLEADLIQVKLRNLSPFYSCNKVLVDELMSFIQTKCKCM